MKVLLREDVDNLGYAGEVLQVADGYGRNYLIPRGLAVKASPGVLTQAHSWRERAAIRLTELRREHEALANKINDTNLNFTARAGETGKLYGSVTTADVTEQLNEVLGTDIDRRLVTGGPLRQLGEHRVTVRLSRDYQPQIMVRIHPFTEVEEDEIEDAETELEEVETSAAVEETTEDEDSEAEISEVDDSEAVVAEDDAPETEVSEADAPEAEVSEADAPETEVSETDAPETEVSETDAPEAEVSESADDAAGESDESVDDDESEETSS